jgi:hypothetical protein
MNRFIFLSGLIILIFVAGLTLAGIPKMINYQGMLTQSDGTTPVTNGNYNLTFKIYGSQAGTDSLWREYHSNVPVTNGLFNVILGSITTLNLAFDTNYWLGIKVGTDPELTPRIRLTSVGYAYRSQRADTASYAGSGPWGGNNAWTFRITDTADTTLWTGGRWGISRYGNTLFGNGDSTHVNLGVACTTGTNGQNYKYCAVGGGVNNIAGGEFTTVGGGRSNTASASYATVGGGIHDTASGYGATVGGGEHNTATGTYATVGGGTSNTASHYATTVGGGIGNTANWLYATVGGGNGNTASYLSATVGGGEGNSASWQYATVGGGASNNASGSFATVPGGYADTAAGDYSFACGREVRITGSADWTFGFGRNFTTSTPNAVIFHNSVDPIKVGIGTPSPGSALHVVSSSSYFGMLRLQNSNTGNNEATMGFIGGSEVAHETWLAGVGPWGTGRNFVIGLANPKLLIDTVGNVGIGTTSPAYKLDVEGYVQAYGYNTGDIIFQKDNQKLWRMFEDENGLYLENLKTGKVYRFVLQGVEKIVPDLVICDKEGKPDAVKYDKVTLYLLELAKAQQKEIDLLKGEIEKLKSGDR